MNTVTQRDNTILEMLNKPSHEQLNLLKELNVKYIYESDLREFSRRLRVDNMTSKKARIILEESKKMKIFTECEIRIIKALKRFIDINVRKGLKPSSSVVVPKKTTVPRTYPKAVIDLASELKQKSTGSLFTRKFINSLKSMKLSKEMKAKIITWIPIGVSWHFNILDPNAVDTLRGKLEKLFANKEHKGLRCFYNAKAFKLMLKHKNENLAKKLAKKNKRLVQFTEEDNLTYKKFPARPLLNSEILEPEVYYEMKAYADKYEASKLKMLALLASKAKNDQNELEYLQVIFQRILKEGDYLKQGEVADKFGKKKQRVKNDCVRYKNEWKLICHEQYYSPKAKAL